MLYTTSYRRTSAVVAATELLHVFLAALRAAELTKAAQAKAVPVPKPWLFRGRVAQPLVFRDSLLVLRDTVNARFFRPDAWRMADPVVTTESEWLRLECFSSDGGVYARVDLPPDAFEEGDLGSEGTTNVDFGPEFGAHLSRLRPGRAAALEVAEDSLTLATDTGTVVERKVNLPDRWVRGFLQVQAISRAAQPRFGLEKVAARRLLANLGRNEAGGQAFVTPDGEVLRRRPASTSAVEVHGLTRLKLLARISPHVDRLSLWSANDAGPSFWSAQLGGARVLLGLSSEIQHGFSGDGEALFSTRAKIDDDLVAAARFVAERAKRLTVDDLARLLEVGPGVAGQLVDLLGEQGVLGYDLPEGRYYWRHLPYVARTGFIAQPRDAHARRLVDASRVQIERRVEVDGGLRAEGWVQGDHGRYRVLAVTDAEGVLRDGDCTCQWILDHRLRRGPCKHILALRLAAGA
jgi:hypothetical protein